MKPRLRFVNGTWYCSLNGIYGFGNTPFQAYCRYEIEPRYVNY